MSSAAKLRHFGKGTAAVATAALVMTAFGPTAFAAWDKAPQDIANLPTNFATTQLPQVEGGTGGGTKIANAGLQDDGTIGIADSSPGKEPGDQRLPDGEDVDDASTLNPAPNSSGETADENQGAKLVQAGQTGQQVADIVFTVPNRFKSGDIIDLRLLDRSATENSDGTSNSGPSTLVGFSEVPTVEVLGPQNAGEVVHPDTDNTSAVNTESTASNAWTSPGAHPANDVRNIKPDTAPKFAASITQTNGVQGHDNLRLRIDGDPSAGDPTAIWTVRLKNVKVDLGPNVTPGELRVVPFASSKFDNQDNYYAVPWFMGNHKNGAVDFNGNPMNSVNSAREINTYTVPAYVAPVTVSSTNTDIVADGNPQTIGTMTLAETKPYALASGQYRLYVEGADVSADTSKLKATLTGGDAGESVSDVTVNTAEDYVQFTYTAVTTNPKTPASIAIDGLMLATGNASQIRYRFSGATLENTWLAPAGYSQAVDGGVADSAALVVQPTTDNSTAWEVASSTVTGRNVVSAITAPTAVGITYSDATAAVLPEGTYKVTQTGPTAFTVAGPITLDGVANGTPKPLPGSVATVEFAQLKNGITFGIDANGSLVLNSTQYTTPLSVAGLTNLPAGNYTASADADGFLISLDGDTLRLGTTGAGTNVDNGQAYVFTPGTNGAQGTATIPAGATFTFQNLVDGMKFTVAAQTTTVAKGANQKDILAPLDELMQTGVAQATSNRIGGADRYETAMKVAASWPTMRANGKIRSVIIASGQNFPDALSSSYLSQRTDSPVLLTMRDRLPADTIAFLKNHFVEEIYVIGGEAAVSAAVEQQLAGLTIWNPRAENDNTPVSSSLPLKVTRLGGATRYTTNQLVNYYAAAWGGGTVGKTVATYGQAGRHTAVVASGSDWPDALAAGVLTVGVRNVPGSDNPDGAFRKIQPSDNDAVKANQAAARRAAALPLILTEGTTLSPAAEAQFHRLDIQHAILVGGQNVLSEDNVMKKIDSFNITTARLAGENRYATAAEVSKFAMNDEVGSATNTTPGLGFIAAEGTDEAVSYLAQGFPTFADALAVGPKVGAEYNVLSLVQPKDLTSWTRTFLEDKAHDLRAVIGVGLADAVSGSVLNDGSRAVSTK